MDIDSLKNKDFNDSATKAPLYILSVNLKDETQVVSLRNAPYQ